MNLLEAIVLGIKLYVQKILWYSLAGMLLFLTILVAAGVASLFFLIDLLIAYYMGPHGTWIHNVPAVAGILASSFLGAVFFAYLLFGSVGAFMHTCAQIGAGKKDMGLLSHFEYLAANAHKYFAVGMVQQAVAAVPLAAVMSATMLLGGTNQVIVWAGVAVSLLLYMAAQYPFWLSFPAMAIKKEGIVASLRRAMSATIRSPIGSAAMLLVIYILAVAPAISLVLYPIYFFLIFCPLAAVLSLVYYEANEGMI